MWRICVAVTALSLPGRSCVAQETPIDFSGDVRPILADKCFRCHGPDQETREAGLRLDTSAGLFESDAASPAVMPGDPDASSLMERILSDDPDTIMPPPDSGKILSNQQKETLRQWIAQGAHWQQHWAFVPPVRSELPKVSQPSWCRNEIDAFILQKLDQHGLQPAPAARPFDLIRRVYLDLTGLPPAPAEADHWVRKIW
ncbi:MAG: c-type cytochrome domain-containing protein, partial [Planctomycetaceae bacterium]